MAMAGNIFINYRRDETSHVAGRLHDRLAQVFGRDRLFMDVDNIPIGFDFEDYLKGQVAECNAMLSIIGPNWLNAKDETGRRRLENPGDFVVIEIVAALARNIPVVPVLVDGARMPKASELPDSLKALARRNAVQVHHTNFGSDTEALVAKMRQALDRTKRERGFSSFLTPKVIIIGLVLLGIPALGSVIYMQWNSGQREAQMMREQQQKVQAKEEAETKLSETVSSQRGPSKSSEAKPSAEEMAVINALVKKQTSALFQKNFPVVTSFGLQLSSLTDDARKAYKINENVKGVVVTSVTEGSLASKEHLKEGDVIVEIAKQLMSNPSDVEAKFVQLKQNGADLALLLVNRTDGPHLTAVPLP